MKKSKKQRLPVLLVVFCVLMLFAQGVTAAAASEQDMSASRQAWFDQFLKMKDTSQFKELTWRYLGPKNISGRCTDVAVVEPRGVHYRIYVATASGGVWRTDNEGLSWQPIFEDQLTASIGDIATVPGKPDCLWVGSGEANIFRSSMAGYGIYKTEDGGKTWIHKGLEKTHTIARVLVHPKDHRIVYVAAGGNEWSDNPERGVYKTTDGGESWSRILYKNSRTGAVDLVMDPRDPDTLYAALWQRIRRRWNDPRNEAGYSESGIYKTTDGGKTWQPVNKGLPEGKFRGRIGIDLCLAQPDTVYALVDHYELSREFNDEEQSDAYGRPSSGIIKGATLFRSDDGAASWRQVSGLTEEMKTYMENHSGTYGWVFGQVKADPKDPETVYTMGLALNVSRDGGKTMKGIGDMHGDHHGLYIDPQNSHFLVNVNDGGIVISYDQGKTWREFLDNLPVVQFYNVGFDLAEPFRVYGSVQDHGSYRAVVNTRAGRGKIPAVNFERAPGGEASTHRIDPRNPNTVYSAGFYGTLYRNDMAPNATKRGVKIAPKAEANMPANRGQWLAPFILSPHNPDVIYMGYQYLYKSPDQGKSWVRISPDLSRGLRSELGDIPYQTIFTISESPLEAGVIYVGTDDGNLHLRRNDGGKWKKIMKGIARDRWISRVVASKYAKGRVYMAQNGKRWEDFNGYLWVSEDYGRNWKSIAANLPGGPINVVTEDPNDENILYAGTDIGAFVSLDRGRNWQVLGGNLPVTYVHDLIVHPRDNVIVIATHGRGMWTLDGAAVNKR